MKSDGKSKPDWMLLTCNSPLEDRRYARRYALAHPVRSTSGQADARGNRGRAVATLALAPKERRNFNRYSKSKAEVRVASESFCCKQHVGVRHFRTNLCPGFFVPFILKAGLIVFLWC